MTEIHTERHKIFGYNTHSHADRKAMLDKIGMDDIEDLFHYIPEQLRLKRDLNLPQAVSEWELEKEVSALAACNSTVKTHLNFMGGGAYEHHIPAVVDELVGRSEYYTSYTPYQPEMSQGLLQTLYEYQLSMACITGNPVVNGSCYDGATAMADAAWASCRIGHAKHAKNDLDRQDANHQAISHEKDIILVSETLWQSYSKVISTYMAGRGVEIHRVPMDKNTGKTDISELATLSKKHKPHGFLFQSPNMFGVIEDIRELSRCCRAHDVISVISWNPICSGLLNPPGCEDIDIVTCEGQPLGIPLSAGGAGLGVFAIKRQYRAYIPGRLIGKVKNIHGHPAYALVFEQREQHIAREKAISNICSNQALHAVRAAIYLSLLGDNGLARLAGLNVSKARYLYHELTRIDGISPAFPGDNPADSFFNEFTILLPVPVEVLLEKLYQQGIFGGIDVSDAFNKAINGSSGKKAHALMIAVTEVKSKSELDFMVRSIANIIQTQE